MRKPGWVCWSCGEHKVKNQSFERAADVQSFEASSQGFESGPKHYGSKPSKFKGCFFRIRGRSEVPSWRKEGYVDGPRVDVHASSNSWVTKLDPRLKSKEAKMNLFIFSMRDFIFGKSARGT